MRILNVQTLFRVSSISAVFATLALVSDPLLASATVQSTAPSTVVIDQLDASINGALVLSSDVTQFRKTVHLRQQLDPLFTGTAVANAGAQATTDDIVQFLIDEKIISQQFPVNDTDVEQEVNSIQSNNHIDRNALKAALREQGFRFEDYFELIRSSASKRNLIDRDIRSKATVSDDDVKNYFLTHYPQDSSGERSYTIQIILVSSKNYKSAEAAEGVAQSALESVKSGEKFEEVAKRVSDDASASSGGELGTLTEDQMSPAIRDEVRKLSTGQISPVLANGKSGFFVIKLVDVKVGESPRLAKLREEIRQQLVAAEYQHQIQLWLQRQRQASFIHIAGQDSLSAAGNGATAAANPAGH
jgi:parvulin-like peptidyl-prolyl isomerase